MTQNINSVSTVFEPRIATVIENDPEIRTSIEAVLIQAGFTTVSASNGNDGVDVVLEHRPIVTTVDIRMPGMDGFETAKRIRAFSDTYIVMLGNDTDEIDVVQGFGAGADDVLALPLRPREMRARVDAMLRRPRALVAPEATTTPPAEWLNHDCLRINVLERRALIDERELQLTRSEFDLLGTLMGSNTRVRSKRELARTLRGDELVDSFVSEHDERAVEVHIANLRKKLGNSQADPRWIETVRGVGYRMAGKSHAHVSEPRALVLV